MEKARGIGKVLKGIPTVEGVKVRLNRAFGCRHEKREDGGSSAGFSPGWRKASL
jgi:hypothetical protein